MLHCSERELSENSEMYSSLYCVTPVPIAGLVTSERVAGRAVAYSPYPTRIAHRRYSPPMSGQRGNLPHAVGGLSAHRDLGTYRLQGDSRCVRGWYKIRHTWER